ncbi:MAG: LD-carboxypeptidase [Actinomycetota bacterium]|nr:LD-carboxypeptidase [Actinomycetota bacterium]
MGVSDRVTHISATLFGAPLPVGGTIGVCAPSGPFYNRSDIERPVEWWRDRGFRVKLSAGVWAQDDYVAGTAEQRAADLNALFADPDVDVIQVLWGGTGAMQVLPHLDYELIAANPKALMGYSDITNLHIAIRQSTGLATLHGPGLGSMGIPERTAFTWDSALDAFMKGGSGAVPRDPDDPYVRSIAPGRAGGPLVGGNLFTFVHLLGTPWDPVFDGCILLLEEVDTPAYVIEVHLDQLRLAGKLDEVAGVVVAEMKGCDWTEEKPEAPRNRSLEDVLERHLAPLGVPVLYKLPLGHGKHLATVPLGVHATLDADARSLLVDEPGVVATT